MDDQLVKHKRKLKRAAKRAGDTTFDRIYKFYYDKQRIELTFTERKIKTRWANIWKLMGDMFTTTETIKAHMKAFKVAESVAYEDMRQAKLLFGDPGAQVDKARKAIFSDFLLKAMRKAEQQGDLLACERFALRYARLHGLDSKEDDELAKLIKQMKPHTIIISGSTTSQQQEADDLMKDVPEVVDVDYDELADGE